MTKKYLFANFLFYMKREGNEAMSSSLEIHYTAIEASSTSLTVLIASILLASVTIKEDTFAMAIKLLIGVPPLFACTNGGQAMFPS